MQEQEVHGEQWEELRGGCSIWACVTESDIGTSCSFCYHLSAFCQLKTYWRKESTLRKGLETAYGLDAKHSVYFTLENKTFIQLQSF